MVGADLVDEGFTLEDAVVSVVRFDSDSVFKCHSFKAFQGEYGIRGIEGHLMFDMDEP